MTQIWNREFQFKIVQFKIEIMQSWNLRQLFILLKLKIVLMKKMGKYEAELIQDI